MYSDYVHDVKVKFNLGIVFCGALLVPLFIFNLTKAIYSGLQKPCLKLKHKCRKFKAKSTVAKGKALKPS